MGANVLTSSACAVLRGAAFSCRARCRPCAAPRPAPRGSVRTWAAVSPEVVTSVTQQGVAFAVVLAVEALYTRSYVPEGDGGRPEPLPVGAGIASNAGAVGLVTSGVAALQTAGLLIGFGGSAAMLAYNILRFQKLKYDDLDWPGPKAWPAGMALISFFALNVFLQGLRADFGI